MDSIFNNMLAPYMATTPVDKKNAAKEVIQEMVLCGLSRSGLFDHAAFYGGTALRIFYGLDRFSEDLDFSLTAPSKEFDISSYFPLLEKEMRSFGLNMSVEQKQKHVDSQIQSAFLKGDTQEHLLLFFPDEQIQATAGEKIKIKFEIDTNPAPFAQFSQRYRLLPAPYQVRLYDEPSLFAGKIHAVLCRGWKNRVKGRDLYDYVFYLSRNTTVNLTYLRAKLMQTGFLQDGAEFEMTHLQNALFERFHAIDYKNAKADVTPFLSNQSSLDLWSEDFFCDITKSLLR